MSICGVRIDAIGRWANAFLQLPPQSSGQPLTGPRLPVNGLTNATVGQDNARSKVTIPTTQFSIRLRHLAKAEPGVILVYTPLLPRKVPNVGSYLEKHQQSL